jgi:DNA-binding response OmpR family regulator
MLTARTSEVDQTKAFSEGVIDYLSKPFNPQLLVELAAQAMLPRDPGAEAERRGRVLEQLRLLEQMRKTH